MLASQDVLSVRRKHGARIGGPLHRQWSLLRPGTFSKFDQTVPVGFQLERQSALTRIAKRFVAVKHANGPPTVQAYGRLRRLGSMVHEYDQFAAAAGIAQSVDGDAASGAIHLRLNFEGT